MDSLTMMKMQLDTLQLDLRQEMKLHPKQFEDQGATGTHKGQLLMFLIDKIKAEINAISVRKDKYQGDASMRHIHADDNITLRFPPRSVYPGDLHKALEKKGLSWVRVITQDVAGFLPTTCVCLNFNKEKAKDVANWNAIWDVIEEVLHK